MQNVKKQTGIIIGIAAGIIFALILIIGFSFDYYFDLNDDVLMKDILSGSYTGAPAGRNIQMLYAVSALISLFYRLFKGADVYGIFLCLCQYGCLFLILVRTLRMVKERKNKVIAAMVEILLIVSCLLSHLIYVQYTFTVSMLAGTAAFLLLTGSVCPREPAAKNHAAGRTFPFSANAVLVCFLVWLGFLVRSEMMLLMLPFLGLAWLFRLSREADRVRRYLCLAAVLFAGLLIGQGTNSLAYHSAKWQEFTALFDARTQLYDYETIPPYEGNETFYNSIGLDESEVALLFNYNFGLDEEIDAARMEQIADYAKSIHEETPMLQRIKSAASEYVYRLHHFGYQEGFEYPQTDAPWNLLLLLFYISVLTILIQNSNFKGLLGIAALFLGRSALWMYILVGERDPIRVTHGLMFTEMCILGGLAVVQMTEGLQGAGKTVNAHQGESRIFFFRKVLFTGIFLLTAASYCPNAVTVAATEAQTREETNRSYDTLYSYIAAHPDTFYWIDVYTSVSYSEKMFGQTDNSLDNYDVLGGWACKSPLQTEKMKAFGFTGISDSLLTDKVLLVIRTEDSTDWLKAYYNDKGIEVTLQTVDTVGDSYAVVQVTAQDAS